MEMEAEEKTPARMEGYVRRRGDEETKRPRMGCQSVCHQDHRLRRKCHLNVRVGPWSPEQRAFRRLMNYTSAAPPPLAVSLQAREPEDQPENLWRPDVEQMMINSIDGSNG